MKRTSVKAVVTPPDQSLFQTVKVNGIKLTVEEFRRLRPNRRRFTGSRKKEGK